MKTDVLLYLRESPGMKEGYRLAAGIREMAGVSDVRFNPDRDRYVQVFYDPDRVDAAHFLEKLAAEGVKASLIAG